MKTKKQHRKNTKIEILQKQGIELVNTMEQSVVFIYLFCMLGIFPLYYKEQYYKIGDAKFEFFWTTSLIFCALFFLIHFIKMLLQKLTQMQNLKLPGRKEQNFSPVGRNHIFLNFIDKLSALDYAVFIYGICVCISYAFSEYKEYAFKGAAGWEMGLCSQLLFLALYFVISRQKELPVQILWVHLTASFLVYGLGILHRFEIDPLGMYTGLTLNQKKEFLSTIGQATWFSSYVCTTFAIGMALFYLCKRKWIRILTGIYTAVSFAVLVTQNSDSAFIAIAGILLLLGYFSLDKIEKWCRFLQIMCLMWGSFAGIGILQKIFTDKIVPLDSLSIFFSQSMWTVMLFFLALSGLFFYTKYAHREKEKKQRLMQATRTIYKGIIIFLMAAVFAVAAFIYFNTKGYLLEWFGYQNTNQYLLFNYQWGNNRGSSWTIIWQAFVRMPFYQKLFGVGPDSLSAYLYHLPDISELLYSLWGNVKLTNAHNEYLNSLMCYGIVGVASWISVLAGGIIYFYRKARQNPYMLVFVLCIMGYACHNIFCYQQVCCTPFLFLFLGMGESLTKSENFNTIK